MVGTRFHRSRSLLLHLVVAIIIGTITVASRGVINETSYSFALVLAAVYFLPSEVIRQYGGLRHVINQLSDRPWWRFAILEDLRSFFYESNRLRSDLDQLSDQLERLRSDIERANYTFETATAESRKQEQRDTSALNELLEYLRRETAFRESSVRTLPEASRLLYSTLLVESLWGRANIHIEQARYDEALRDLEYALKLGETTVEFQSDSPNMLANLAQVHLRLAQVSSTIGREDEAIKYYDRAIKLSQMLMERYGRS